MNDLSKYKTVSKNFVGQSPDREFFTNKYVQPKEVDCLIEMAPD